jgi:hypothetical protein
MAGKPKLFTTARGRTAPAPALKRHDYQHGSTARGVVAYAPNTTGALIVPEAWHERLPNADKIAEKRAAVEAYNARSAELHRVEYGAKARLAAARRNELTPTEIDAAAAAAADAKRELDEHIRDNDGAALFADFHNETWRYVPSRRALAAEVALEADERFSAASAELLDALDARERAHQLALIRADRGVKGDRGHWSFFSIDRLSVSYLRQLLDYLATFPRAQAAQLVDDNSKGAAK